MTLFTWAGFAVRNPAYVTKKTRESWAVASAMKSFSKANRVCAWCGSTKSLQVHHVEPVSVAPERAADQTNMIMLCAKWCHITVGHLGDYADSFVRNLNDVCGTVQRIKVKP